MPTRHVEPRSAELLEHVANALLRARKVVVVTGAGISTNAGIPDFRSENGLYSLVQARFDAAARLARQAEPLAPCADADADADRRPSKRCKVTPERSPEPPDDGAAQRSPEIIVEPPDTTSVQPLRPPSPDEAGHGFGPPRPEPDAVLTSPLSSPPADDCLIPPSTLRPQAPRRLVDASLPRSSSPLSSPPSVLFDPFIPSSPSADASSRSRRSSTPPSDDAATTPSSIPSSSHASNPPKATLPNIKGKDLFDAAIWSDPVRTSVFYTFATSLRQRIRAAEPTSSHRFISHLRDRGKLVRCYTQNIDQMEEKVGLSTRLHDGPGCRGRFSRRSTANTNQLQDMADEASAAPDEKPSQSDSDSSQPAAPSDGSSTPGSRGEPPGVGPGVDPGADPGADPGKPPPAQPPRRQAPPSGVECVFLHGSLELLRCFLCGRVCSWDDQERESETLAGQQPECPHCVGATAAREEKGKRALGIGKLRPDIVLYGEDHPSSHLISPIVTRDLALHPDMLLILGTSLRVHGLKVMVREFAKAVHSKKGTVVFVNLTKPPESSWGDVIDYWVQWDCDAWVADLRTRVPRLWQDPPPPRGKKKRAAGGTPEDVPKAHGKRPPAANPVALRDTKVTGAYWTLKVLQELRRITGRAPLGGRASASAAGLPGRSVEASPSPLPKGGKARPRRPRKSAPGALEKPERLSSTLNPNHGRSKASSANGRVAISSMLNAVKERPRVRRRKVIDGHGVPAPSLAIRRGGSQGVCGPAVAELKLPPLRSPPAQEESPSPFGRPQPLEPPSPPSGPLASLSPNLRSAQAWRRTNAFYLDDSLVRLLDSAPRWPAWTRRQGGQDEASATPADAARPSSQGKPEGRLARTGGPAWAAGGRC